MATYAGVVPDFMPYFARVEYNERIVLARLGGGGLSEGAVAVTALSSTSKASWSLRWKKVSESQRPRKNNTLVDLILASVGEGTSATVEASVMADLWQTSPIRQGRQASVA